MPTIVEKLNAALQLHNAGELRRAEEAYGQVLAINPRQPDALHLLGRLALQTGQLDEAIKHLSRASTECNVFDSTLDYIHAALDLGRALELKGDVTGACNSYQRVLARWGKAKPRSVSAEAARARAAALKCPAR